MARALERANSEYFSLASGLSIGLPVSFAAWVKPRSQAITVSDIVVAVQIPGTEARYALQIQPNLTARVLHHNGTTSTSATTTQTLSVGSWAHLAATTGTGSRTVWLNGVGVSNSTASSAITPTEVHWGHVQTLTIQAYADMDIECGTIWSGSLTTAEVALMAKGIHPLAVHPGGLIEHVDFTRGSTGRKGNVWVENGTISVVPNSGKVWFSPSSPSRRLRGLVSGGTAVDADFSVPIESRTARQIDTSMSIDSRALSETISSIAVDALRRVAQEQLVHLSGMATIESIESIRIDVMGTAFIDFDAVIPIEIRASLDQDQILTIDSRVSIRSDDSVPASFLAGIGNEEPILIDHRSTIDGLIRIPIDVRGALSVEIDAKIPIALLSRIIAEAPIETDARMAFQSAELLVANSIITMAATDAMPIDLLGTLLVEIAERFPLDTMVKVIVEGEFVADSKQRTDSTDRIVSDQRAITAISDKIALDIRSLGIQFVSGNTITFSATERPLTWRNIPRV